MGAGDLFRARLDQIINMRHELVQLQLDFSFQPSLDRNRILALAQLGFIDRNEVIHSLGPTGTGKSHLATALGVEAVNLRLVLAWLSALLRLILDTLIQAFTRRSPLKPGC